MQKRIYCDHTCAVLQALSSARRRLDRLNGMLAVDTTAPQKSFVIETGEAVAILDDVLKDVRRSKVYEMYEIED